MAWFSFGGEDIGEQLRAIRGDLSQIRSMTMTTNDELAQIKAKLEEAATEIPAKIDELIAQAGDAVDPALVEQIKTLAGGLADVVPNPEPEPEGEDVPDPDLPDVDEVAPEQ